MTLTDGTNDLPIYGSTANASALMWDAYGDSYVYTQQQDFLTNAITKDIKVGDTVKMKLIRCDYGTSIEGQGIILSFTPVLLNAETLLGYDGSTNAAYSTDYANKVINGVTFTYQQIAAYNSNFAGMQFRNKLSDSSNGTKSNLNNTTALPAPISSIDFEWHSSKTIRTNSNVLKITFGKDNSFATSTEVVMLNTTEGVETMSVTPTGKDFTFVKIEIDDNFTYACFWNSIKLNLADY